MRFMSKSKRLRVVLKPSFYVIDANGQRVLVPGKTVEFMNGRYETSDPEEIATMLNHPLFNSKFVAVEDDVQWRNEHPEYFQSPVTMINGAVSTVNSSVPPLFHAATAPIRDLAKERNIQPNQAVDLDSIIEAKIESALGALNSKLEKLIGYINEPEVREDSPPKPKRTFKCPVPGCDFVGKTGIEVGEHKKAAHTS